MAVYVSSTAPELNNGEYIFHTKLRWIRLLMKRGIHIYRCNRPDASNKKVK